MKILFKLPVPLLTFIVLVGVLCFVVSCWGIIALYAGLMLYATEVLGPCWAITLCFILPVLVPIAYVVAKELKSGTGKNDD